MGCSFLGLDFVACFIISVLQKCHSPVLVGKIRLSLWETNIKKKIKNRKTHDETLLTFYSRGTSTIILV